MSATARVVSHSTPRGSMRRRHDPYLWALIALAVLYLIVFTGMAWELHAGMRTHRADLGQIDQAIWNSSRGRLLAQTDNGFEATRLTDHVEPILVLISPIYWLWDDVRALLLLQVAATAAGVLPLYVLALRRFEVLLSPRERRQVWRIEPLHQLARPLAFALGVAYLLAPQLQSALLTEFHAAPLAVPLLLWAFWAVDAQRWGQFGAAALLVAAVKEEMALLAFGLGVWAVWRTWWEGRQEDEETRGKGEAAQGRRGAQENEELPGRRGDGARRARPTDGYLAGVAVAIVGLLWFYLATFVIVPAHAAEVYGVTESTYFQRYGALGDSSADILKSMVARPGLVLQIASEPARTAYLVGLLAAFAWLSLLGIDVVLLALPLLLANLLSAYPAQYYGEFHYSAPLVPYFAAAAAYGAGRFWRALARRLDRGSPSYQHLPAQGTGAMAAAAMAQNPRTALLPLMTVGLVVWVLAWSVFGYIQHGRGPGGGRYDPAPVTPHHLLLDRFLAQIPGDAAVTATAAVHPHVSHRRYVYQFPLGLDAPAPADWALLDVTTNTDMAPGDLKTKVDEMLAGDWGVVDAADGFLLLAKGQGGKEIPDAFYSFTRVETGESLPPEPLRLAALRADDWPRWRQTKFIFEWLVGADYDPAATPPWAEIGTLQQEVLATLSTAAPPALVWYPPERWAPGDRVRVTTLPLYLPRTVDVRAAGSIGLEAARFRRDAQGALIQLPADTAAAPDLAVALEAAGFGPSIAAEAEMSLDNASTPLRVWVEDRLYWPGDVLDVWVQWGVRQWPENLAAFVHLRRNGETVAQADGGPTNWATPVRGIGDGAALNDWRQLVLPAGVAPDGEWTLAIGLYDPASGERVAIGAGNELVLGPLRVAAPPPPDQACALNPQTCASAPR